MVNRLLRNFIITNIAVIAIAVCFIIVSYTVKGKEGFECAFLTLTGFYCPGCGGTRALYSLLRFDVISAVKYNAAIPFGAFVYIYYNIRAIICLVKKDDSYFKNNRYYLCIAFAAVLVCNFILKNMLLLCFDVRFM